jgi:hypothetical protein
VIKKILKNTPKTKAYLDSLPKVYGIFLWAKWGILELPWSGKYTKGDIAVPLVYHYYDANGTCDEYRLVPITSCSSGAFWDWYEFKNNAKEVQEKLNEALSRGEIGYDEYTED